MYQTLLFEVREPGIGLLTMNRPDVLNALSIQTFQELNALFDRITKTHSVENFDKFYARRSNKPKSQAPQQKKEKNVSQWKNMSTKFRSKNTIMC